MGIEITLGTVCDGGGHVSLAVSVDGAKPQSFVFSTEELRAPLGADEVRAAVFAHCRLQLQGKTKEDAAAALQDSLAIAVGGE